jgi:hypothetical protein
VNLSVLRLSAGAGAGHKALRVLSNPVQPRW